MRFRVSLAAMVLCFCTAGFLPDHVTDDRDALDPRKIADDSDRSYTTAGNIALTISNYGTIGSRNAYWPDQPSCEYPRGSRIEHIYQGGLWVGAVSRTGGDQRVSTGSHDRVFTSSAGGPLVRPEFASEVGSQVIQRSSLSESRYFDESAISHQDFVGFYSDRFRSNPTTGDTLPDHTPLGISIRQESYAWNFPFADFFVLLSYTIYNTGTDTLDSVYVGLWNNAVVHNTNNVRPGAPQFFEHGANGYADSLRMMYTFDFDGQPTPPPADSYIGIKLLGSTPFPRGVDSVADLTRRASFYNAWGFRRTSPPTAYFSPQADAEFIGGARSRYDRLASAMDTSFIGPLRLSAGNFTTMVSSGPFATLVPGDSLNVVFAVICARKFGSQAANLDTREQRRTLYTNAGFAQQAYDGEDVNGNNILDPGEDLDGNGRLDHFRLPQPPRPPKVRLEVENQNVTLYWDKSTSESSIDPITREFDFEGYRIYRSNPGADFISPEALLLTLTLAGEFDVPGNSVGYNTGFNAISLPEARTFPGDTVAYWYRFPPAGSNVSHLNGWQYLYGVAAFDRGDTATGIVSLQSKTEIRRAIPGTVAAPLASKIVGVYPNPYYVNAIWDGSGERSRKIYFYNLPARCEIRVYTLAGDVVADMVHDAATYDGSNIQWFQRFGGVGVAPQFAGGEHAWDLISKFDQAIATGLYLFSVRDSDTGEIKTGKFMVVK